MRGWVVRWMGLVDAFGDLYSLHRFVHTHTPARKPLLQKRAAEKAVKQAAQEDVQSLRTWEFLGGKQGDMWLLTDDQVRCVVISSSCLRRRRFPSPTTTITIH